MIEEIRMPEERMAIIIGKRGEILKRLRRDTRTLVFVNEDIIRIEGEPLNVWSAKNVILAIIHGFSPTKAFSIINGKIFETIDLTEFVPKNRLETVKSRLIGKNGRTRELLEEHTTGSISIDGKYISVIGEEANIRVILDALEMLINGYSHRVVYKFLERGGVHHG